MHLRVISSITASQRFKINKKNLKKHLTLTDNADIVDIKVINSERKGA